MARRMYSIDQISGSNVNFVAGNGINIENNEVDKSVTISLILYKHNIEIVSFDQSMHAYFTIYSTYDLPVSSKQELVDNLLAIGEGGDMSATGFAENHTKIIYAIETFGTLHYTDLQGNEGMYDDDYAVSDALTFLGG